MDSSVSPTYGDQEGTAYNGHFACTCYHPLFVFNQFGDLERCVLRSGNVHSADGWKDVLEPVVVRYWGKFRRRYFRADAAFANPEVYEFLETEGFKYAIRLPANQILQERIAYLLKRPVGRPPIEVRRYYSSFSYQAQSWKTPRRVVTKVEWHPGELYPRVGFIVTNMARSAERVVVFYNQRGTAEQWIKEGQECRQVGAAVMLLIRRQRRAASASCAGLQSFQLHAYVGSARGGQAVVADEPAGEAHQNRRQDCEPWPLRHIPGGRGRSAEGIVPGDSAADRRSTAKTDPSVGNGTAGCVITTGGVCLDDEEKG